jgi:hypothetical protein
MTRLASVLIAFTVLFAAACHDDDGPKLCSGSQVSLDGVPCCTQIAGGTSCQAGDHCVHSSDVTGYCICDNLRWSCGDPPLRPRDMSVTVPPPPVDAATQD